MLYGFCPHCKGHKIKLIVNHIHKELLLGFISCSWCGGTGESKGD